MNPRREYYNAFTGNASWGVNKAGKIKEVGRPLLWEICRAEKERHFYLLFPGSKDRSPPREALRS